MAINEKYFRVKNGLTAPEITSASLSVDSDIVINNEPISSTFLRKDTASAQYLPVSTFLSGPSYPQSANTNSLFFNTQTNRLGIFVNSVWKEFALLAEVIDLIAGNAATAQFSETYSAGDSTTDVFVNQISGGTSIG